MEVHGRIGSKWGAVGKAGSIRRERTSREAWHTGPCWAKQDKAPRSWSRRKQLEDVNIRKGGDFTPRKRETLAQWKVRTRAVFRRINMAAQQWINKEGKPGARSCQRRTLDFKIYILLKL